MNRKNCVVCNHTKLKQYWSVKNFPVYMGSTNIKHRECLYEDLVYGVCENCLELQILNLIPLEILYQDNHNTEVIGKIWEEHNKNFSNFIKKDNPINVFEIGSPSATIFKNLQNEIWLEKWVTVEPNPVKINDINSKYTTIVGFIDENFKIESFGYDKFDAVVLSHVFEHFYEPKKMLLTISNLLKNGGYVYISIPNMKYISENTLMPPCGMHFEHSFYIDEDNIVNFLIETDFILKDIIHHEKHSVFIKLEKTNIENKKPIIQVNKTNYLFKTIEFYKEKIEEINNSILNFTGDVYVYGSHFPAQYLYFNGLNTKKIIGCLDQSKTKIGKTLYGTNLKVYHPNELLDKKNIGVIVYMGPYTNEIKDTLLKINKEIKFL